MVWKHNMTRYEVLLSVYQQTNLAGYHLPGPQVYNRFEKKPRHTPSGVARGSRGGGHHKPGSTQRGAKYFRIRGVPRVWVKLTTPLHTPCNTCLDTSSLPSARSGLTTCAPARNRCWTSRKWGCSGARCTGTWPRTSTGGCGRTGTASRTSSTGRAGTGR